MNTWREVFVETIDMITEDKLMAILCLTLLGICTIFKYPIQQSLPILTAIIGGISGFVTGITMNKKRSDNG